MCIRDRIFRVLGVQEGFRAGYFDESAYEFRGLFAAAPVEFPGLSQRSRYGASSYLLRGPCCAPGPSRRP
eukprot:359652-Alexandrium_andersonii.AAC.1